MPLMHSMKPAKNQGLVEAANREQANKPLYQCRIRPAKLNTTIIEMAMAKGQVADKILITGSIFFCSIFSYKLNNFLIVCISCG